MNLRKWLKEREMPIRFFAALIKVDPSYVRRWFRGEWFPSEKIMEEIRLLTSDKVNDVKELQDEEDYKRRKKRDREQK